MEIWQLRCFIALADTLSFSRAAESLYLSQSALSRRISDLEKELGFPLFTRSTRNVALTEQGLALQTVAKDIISRWEKVVPTLRDSPSGQDELITLSLGFDPRALTEPRRRIRIMDAIFDLRRQYPGIRVLFRHQDYQELVQSLLNRQLDCALVLDRHMEHRAEIDSRILHRERMALVLRSKNTYAPEDFGKIIMRRGLVLVDREVQGLHHIFRILNDLKLEPQIRFCQSLDDMTLTVESGESAAILPQSVIAQLNNPSLQVISLPTEYAELELSALWVKNQPNSFLPTFVDILTLLLTSPLSPEAEKAVSAQ